jgi:predicted nucleotidyltransferase
MATLSKKTREEIKKMTRVIVSQFKPEKIILFGSHAWGEPDENSDVDLLVIKKTNNRWRTRNNMDGALYPRYTPLDLLVYTPKQVEKKYKEDFFIKKIIKEGAILYEKQ